MCFTRAIENIVEEVADPDDLIADFVANPLMVIFAFTAALASLFLILLFAITLILLVLAIGPIDVLLVLMLLSFVVLVGAIVAFLYVRTDIPAGVYHKINNAFEQADDSSEKEGSMTQEEAIKQVKTSMLRGHLTTTNLIRHSTTCSQARIPRKLSSDTRKITTRRNANGKLIDCGYHNTILPATSDISTRNKRIRACEAGRW